MAGGIGRAIALALTQHGTTALISADIDLKAAESVVEQAQENASKDKSAVKACAMQVDVTSEPSVQEMVESVREKFGRIDYFVNASGVSPSLVYRTKSTSRVKHVY